MKEDAHDNWLRALGKNDFLHSENVAKYLNRLVPDKVKETFDPGEIFALLYAVYLHDIGYSIDKKNHEKNSYDDISQNFSKYKLNNAYEARAVALVCYGHASEKECSLGKIDKRFGIAGLSDNPLNLQFLAALFRLADEIDNAYTRVIGYPEQKESMRHRVRFVDIDVEHWSICFQTAPTNSDEWEKLESMRKYTQERLNELAWVIEPKGLLYNRIELEPADNPYLSEESTQASSVIRLLYLQSVVEEHKHWRHLYVELEGQTVEQQRALRQGLSALIEPELMEYVTGQLQQVRLESLFELVKKPYNVMLLGEPGSGKTTALKRIALKVAEDGLQSEVSPSSPTPTLPVNGEGERERGGYSERRVPILLPLSSLQNADVEGWVRKRCELLAPHLDGYLKAGQCIFLWDALNEMPFESEEQYAAKLNALKQFMKDYPDNRFIWSCRRLDYKESLPLQQVEILPLSWEKIRQFFHNLREIGEEEAGDALLEELEQRGGKFDELFGRPLMLELLCAVYEYNRQAGAAESIPQNRGKLFETFVKMLMDREQKKGGVLPQRYSPEVQKVALQQFAFAMMDALGTKSRSGTAVSIAWAREHLPEACDDELNYSIAIDPDDLLDLAAGETILEFLSNRSQVRFWHQSLHEYFAARELQKRLNAREDLTRILKPPWWCEHEAPAFARTEENRYEPLPPPDPTGWEETVIMLSGIHPALDELIHCVLPQNPILAGRCLIEGVSGKELARLKSVKLDVVQALVETATNPQVALRVRIAAGDVLGFLSDPRLITPQTVNAHGAREYLIGREDGKGMSVMVEIPAGDFLMGSTDKDKLAFDDEKPQREVYLDAYLIDKYPVTYSQYREFIEDNGYYQRRWWSDDGWKWLENQKRNPEQAYLDAQLGIVPWRWNDNRFNKPNFPVVGVTWHEADAFARWCGKQLPTEAQWEKAARGTDGRIYPWGDNFDSKRCNCWEGESPWHTTPVGIYPTGASPYGVLDMAGNVWEWCLDEYQIDFCTGHVLRGGSWNLKPDNARAADRNWRYPDFGYFNGFRCSSPRFP